MSTRRPPAASEPMFNVPAPVVVVVASILLSYLPESLAPDRQAVDAWLGLDPAGLASGRIWPFLTVLLVHASWMHAGLNALGALAFGTPVARALGARRVWRFLLFYVLCGIAGSCGYIVLEWGRAGVLVGASGAVSGLMGASSRLIERRGPSLAPFASRTVVAMAAAWVLINALLALNWIDAGTGGAPVAWQAHLAGYAAGLLLIGPFVAAGRSRSD